MTDKHDLKVGVDMARNLTAQDVMNIIRLLPPTELYKLADIMDFGDDGRMWSYSASEAIEKAEYDYSEDGEPYVACELHLGMYLGSINLKIHYENIAAEDDDPDWVYKSYEILEKQCAAQLMKEEG